METNTIVMICAFIFLVILISISFYIEHLDTKKKAEESRIFSIQNPIRYNLSQISEYAESYGDVLYNDLMDFANKMDKLTEPNVKKDLKPYDAYNIKKICFVKGHYKINLLCRIVIDKNLVPKFLASPQSLIPERCDIQLEASLNTEDVKKLAETCRTVKMNKDIETFRKKKVNEEINK